MQRTIAALLAVVFASGSPASAQQPLTVVELFTSQGCSSCPPADRLLGELASREDVLALSFHVDYWNYIGWVDPFSRALFTTRQREYARLLGLRHVYTPQIVIQGRRNAVGSDREAVLGAIAEVSAAERVLLQAAALPDGSLRVDVAPGPGPGEVLLVVFDREHRTRVGRGENRGRDLVNVHVVRELSSLGEWHGVAQSYPVPAAADRKENGRAVLLQSTRDGRILGASRL